MARLKLKYVMPIRKPDGRLYYYFRRKKSVQPLPGLPGSAEFMDAYAICLNALPQPQAIGSSRTIAGTVNAAIVAYYQDYRFTKNRPISQATDRNILEAFRARTESANRSKNPDKSVVFKAGGGSDGNPICMFCQGLTV